MVANPLPIKVPLGSLSPFPSAHLVYYTSFEKPDALELRSETGRRSTPLYMFQSLWPAAYPSHLNARISPLTDFPTDTQV